MYSIRVTPHYKKRIEKATKNDQQLAHKLMSALTKLQTNPYDPTLKTHVVNTRSYGKRNSSKVTGDLRIIWDFDEYETLVIIMLDFGGHTGKRGVYN